MFLSNSTRKPKGDNVPSGKGQAATAVVFTAGGLVKKETVALTYRQVKDYGWVLVSKSLTSSSPKAGEVF